MKMAEFGPLTQAVIDGNGKKVIELVNKALAEKASPQSILTNYLIPGMIEVGKLMAEGEYFIPEVLKSAKSMNGALEILEPLLASGKRESAGYAIMGTVDGDIHDIGKNLVTMMMTGAGYEVTDLGVDVSRERFLDAIFKDRPDLVGLSALLTTTMQEMKDVIKTIHQALPNPPKVIVGGAPVTQTFADEIRADGYAEDAVRAVELANHLLSSGE